VISQRGEIWWVALDPTKGHELRKTRPAVVVSLPAMTAATGMAWVVPLTGTNRGWIFHVAIPAGRETGLRNASFAMVEQLRSVDVARLSGKLGAVRGEALTAIDDKLRLVLGWPPA